MNLSKNVYLTRWRGEPIDVKTSSNGTLMYRDLYSPLTKSIWLTVKESLWLADRARSGSTASSALAERILLPPHPLPLLPWPPHSRQ